MSAFPFISMQQNVSLPIIIILDGFHIRCNTLLTYDKMNFSLSGRCNQRAICLSAQNYLFLLALHICCRTIVHQSVLTQGEWHASWRQT